MRQLAAVLVFAACHFILTFMTLFVGGGLIMATVDGEGSLLFAGPAFLGMAVLSFPVVALSSAVPGIGGVGTAGDYALFGLNSMVWGVGGAIAWSRRRRRRRSRSAPKPPLQTDRASPRR
jgi:hypothetical protein